MPLEEMHYLIFRTVRGRQNQGTCLNLHQIQEGNKREASEAEVRQPFYYEQLELHLDPHQRYKQPAKFLVW